MTNETTELPDVNALLAETLNDIRQSGEAFQKEMSERQAQYRDATASLLSGRGGPMPDELKETIQLVQSVPKIAPAVLKYTRELLARIQAAVDGELNK